LQRGVAPVLLDDEESDTRAIARLDHRQTVRPPGSHGLFSHDMDAGVRTLDSLAGVKAARSAESDQVGTFGSQELRQVCVAFDAGLAYRIFQGLRVVVADSRQLYPAGMLPYCRQVIRSDPAAADDSDADRTILDWLSWLHANSMLTQSR
jgi:hypothetical protein